MARPRRDGRPAKPVAKRSLTPLFVTRKNLPPGLTWDTDVKGLTLRVQPSGHRSYSVVYSRHGRPRWYTLGAVNALGLADARELALEIMLEVARGNDPAAEKKARSLAGTYQELAARYVAEYASKNNKSWRQADRLVTRWVLPRWAKLKPTDISRHDVESLKNSIAAPMLANQTLAAASAIFSWAIKKGVVTSNPCKLIDLNPTKARERILSDSEVPRFWAAFDKAGLRGTALKLILLTGQRPGEVSNMRHEHIEDGWWTLPGAPDAKLGWPGTKNGATHRVWLPAGARALIGTATTGFVLAKRGGKAVRLLDEAMRTICADLGIANKVTPHDLRRTHGSTITGLGFGRESMNRIQNHREGGIADVYDRHEYADQNKLVMEAVAARIMALAEGRPVPNNMARLKAV